MNNLSFMHEKIYNQTPDKLRESERLERLEVKKVCNLCLEERAIKSLLDIGTGTGIFAECFNNAGIKVTGIDLNPEYLKEAKSFVPEAEFIIASAENIPYLDNSFDATFFGLVLHEVDNPKTALSEAYRVTRKTTFVLEWKYVTQDFGPPIEHRLPGSKIVTLAEETNYKECQIIELKNLLLYKLSK